MRLTPEARDALASEYVLGTLRGGARRRFEALARADRATAEAVARWEAKLTPLAERVASVEPPARVWKQIEARIGGAKPESLGVWRALALLSSGLAAILVVAFLWLSPQREGEPYVAVLTASDAVPRMVVSLDARGEVYVRMLKPWANVEDKALELWAVPKNGAPRSLGLVRNDRDTRLRLASADARLVALNAFAVSLEPPGGSPTGKPTGPVLCSGAIAPYPGARRAA